MSHVCEYESHPNFNNLISLFARGAQHRLNTDSSIQYDSSKREIKKLNDTLIFGDVCGIFIILLGFPTILICIFQKTQSLRQHTINTVIINNSMNLCMTYKPDSDDGFCVCIKKRWFRWRSSVVDFAEHRLQCKCC